jgi:hypothetical protein
MSADMTKLQRIYFNVPTVSVSTWHSNPLSRVLCRICDMCIFGTIVPGATFLPADTDTDAALCSSSPERQAAQCSAEESLHCSTRSIEDTQCISLFQLLYNNSNLNIHLFSRKILVTELGRYKSTIAMSVKK